jgi:O-glycosyl hydrolase
MNVSFAKIFFMSLVFGLVLAFSGCGSRPAADEGLVINSGEAKKGTHLKVDPDKTYQKMKGFGASMGMGADYFYSSYDEATLRKALAYLYDKDEGIGLISYRYNVGGGFHRGDPIKQTQCVEVSPGVYDLTRDRGGIFLLDEVIKLGISQVTLFMNSPPGRMTVTGLTNGHPEGKTNLKPEYFEEYADYCAGVTKAFVDAGYPITYVSPINEPQWGWERGEQEGTYFAVDEVLKIDRMVIKKIAALGLDVKVSVPESATWGDDVYTLGFIKTVYNDPEILNAIDHFSSHSYGVDVGKKESLAFALSKVNERNIPLHQTEWCPPGEDLPDGELGIGTGMILSKILHEDLTVLNCELWEYWTGLERDTSWPGGLVYIRSWKGPVEPGKQMYVLGNYAKFITGSTRIGLSVDENQYIYASAWLGADGKKITVVAANSGRIKQNISFDGLDGRTGKVYETSKRTSLDCIGDIDASFGYGLPAMSVTTFVFE